MPQESKIYDVVIVGGGLTGLVAAHRCNVRHGKKVLVLEARDRVGGRTETVELGAEKKGFFDHGGRFVADYQEDVAALIKELGLERFDQYQGVKDPDENSDPPWLALGANLLQIDREAALEAYVGPVIPKTAEAQFYLKYLASLIDDFPTHDPMRMENASALDQLSVLDWLNHANLPGFGKPNPEFRALVRLLCRVGFSEEPENISLLWLMFYIASSGGLDRFQSVRFPQEGAQASRLATGAQSIANKLREVLTGREQEVKTGVRVTGIEQVGDDLVKVHADGSSFSARKVLVALSPSLYGRADFIEFDPELPPGRLAAAQAMRTPAMIVATVTFKTAFWREPKEKHGTFFGQDTPGIARHGFSGDVLFADGPVVWMMDATTAQGHAAIFAFMVATEAERLSAEGPDARQTTVMTEMWRAFGQEAVQENFLEYHERNWSQEIFSGGGPTAHFGKGTFLPHAKEILLIGRGNPHRNVYFASSETALTSNGYMSGAVWSGKKVADEICGASAAKKLEVTRRVREAAMLWSIRTVLRAIEKQQPALELPALSKAIQFYGPGGETLPRGPYGGHSGTFKFYQLLARHVRLTRVNIESYCVNVDQNWGFAAFSISGVVSRTGNPFRDIPATMAFDFNDAESDSVVITRDWLFMDAQEVDALVKAPVDVFSVNGSQGEKDKLEALAHGIVHFDDGDVLAKRIAAFDDGGAGVLLVPTQVWDSTENRKAVPRATPPQPYSEAVKPLARRFKAAQDKKENSTRFDYTSMTYYSSRELDGQHVLTTVRFSSSANPEVIGVTIALMPIR